MKRLVYEKTGISVHLGDGVVLNRGKGEVVSMRPPHKPSSSGFVTVRFEDGWEQELYVTVINAKWIEGGESNGA